MYFIGIDISKYKHDCFVVSGEGETPCRLQTLSTFIIPQLFSKVTNNIKIFFN